MSQPLRVTLVYEPPADDPGPLTSGVERFSRLRSELGRHAGSDVAVVEGPLCDAAPDAGFVLLAAANHPSLALERCSPPQRADLARRTVPIDVSRKGVLDMLERFELAGAIESLALAEWEGTDPGSMGAWGLYGRKELGSSVGAACQTMYMSPRYCYLESTVHRGLAHLLAEYLRAVARTSLA